MLKKIRCTNCKNITTIEGNSGELKTISCPSCGLKGNFRFPKDTESLQIVKEKFTRPLGITILAILHIIGTIIWIFYLLVIPRLSRISINELYKVHVFEFFIIYMLITIPISLFLAYGLLLGKEWARFTSVLFRLTSVITAIIRFNLFGIVIQILILDYLRKPHVKKFFHTEKGLRKDVKLIIISGIIILLIFNIYSGVLRNPFI